MRAPPSVAASTMFRIFTAEGGGLRYKSLLCLFLEIVYSYSQKDKEGEKWLRVLLVSTQLER